MRANICIYIRTGPLQSGGGFIVDVEAAGADAWPKCGNQIRCVRAAMQHGLDSVLGNIGCGATPAGMYCGNTATLRIGNQNGQAVRCAHGDGGLRRISQQYVRCYRVGGSSRCLRTTTPPFGASVWLDAVWGNRFAA